MSMGSNELNSKSIFGNFLTRTKNNNDILNLIYMF